jgi:hypothetical protein
MAGNPKRDERARFDERYMWFEDVSVQGSLLDGLCCIVNGQRVPLPLVMRHPDCTLEQAGDVGRLGVPVSWAIEHGLVPGLRP